MGRPPHLVQVAHFGEKRTDPMPYAPGGVCPRTVLMPEAVAIRTSEVSRGRPKIYLVILSIRSLS